MRVLGIRQNFLGIDVHCGWEEAGVVVVPAPLEATTTYLKGTRRGPAALIEASRQVEWFDDELKTETFRRGVATVPPVAFHKRSLKGAVNAIDKRIAGILSAGKKPMLLGGEHTVSVGAVRACKRAYPDLSVLHLDAHADLRQQYEGSPFNHACAMARIMELCPFVSAGIRNYSQEEADLIHRKGLRIYDIHTIRGDAHWTNRVIAQLKEHVYLTLDLDVLDPSVMPAVGTPEPGGLGWEETLSLLRILFNKKQVVGVDIVELCPLPGTDHGVFTAAKLAYRIFGYWTK